MSFFDDFLKTVPAADQEVLNRYPTLKASTEQMERDVQLLAPHAQRAIEWDKWRDAQWDEHAGMTVVEKGLRTELAAAQARLNAGIGTRSDASAVIDLKNELQAKIDATKAESLRAVEGMNYFYNVVSNRLLPHQKEFGENLDSQKLMDYMTASKINDPSVAYDKMVAGRRTELAAKAEQDRTAAQQTALEAAKKEGYEQAARERAMGPGGMSPTDQTGGIAGITAHVAPQATISDEVKAKAAEAKLGDGSLAALGHEMYRRGQLPVQ
jgi:hypothetical protein